MTTPMTAAEYDRYNSRTLVWADVLNERLRILAALEEREALLGQLADARREINLLSASNGHLRREMDAINKSDASVGALVRRIGELQPSAYLTWAGHPMCYYVKHPSVLQSALDSLLPKEPEVAPSGWRYEPGTHPYVRQIDHEGGTLTIRRADSDAVPPCDREFVARLLGARNAH